MKKKENNSDWIELEYGAHLNLRWLEYGLKVLCANENYYNYAEIDFFKVNHKTTLCKRSVQREIKLCNDINGSGTHNNNFESAQVIFSKLNEFSQENSDLPLIQPMKNETFYFESAEKKEVFIPFLSESSNGDANPLYLSLSLNNLSIHSHFKEKFNGFKRFVTTGCLFGGSLQAIDKKGAIFPIIQHKISFTEGDQIVHLNPPDKNLHLYEQAQFNSLRDNLLLMKKMVQKNVKTEVIYHLPHMDYILSGIKLFIHNKISYEALLDFYMAVKERSEKHVEIIKNIFKGSGLTLRLESPFINLLKDFCEGDYDILYISNLNEFKEITPEESKIYISLEDGYLIYKILSPTGKQEEGATNVSCTEQEFFEKNRSEIAQKILDFIVEKGHARGLNAFLFYLGIPLQKMKFMHHKKMEQGVTKIILGALCNNEISPEYAAVWKDMLRIDFGRDKIRGMESLFKVANAVVIAVAAKGFADYTLCSFLPFNENPIFNKYKRCNEQFSASGISYPEVFSLMRLEDLIFYSHISSGNVFYFQPNSSRLGSILNNRALINYNVSVNKRNVLKEDVAVWPDNIE